LESRLARDGHGRVRRRRDLGRRRVAHRRQFDARIDELNVGVSSTGDRRVDTGGRLTTVTGIVGVLPGFDGTVNLKMTPCGRPKI